MSNTGVVLNAQDRCDRCGAQAYMLTSKQDLMLYFCFHHMKRFTEKLRLEGWTTFFDFEALGKLIPEEQVAHHTNIGN